MAASDDCKLRSQFRLIICIFSCSRVVYNLGTKTFEKAFPQLTMEKRRERLKASITATFFFDNHPRAFGFDNSIWQIDGIEAKTANLAPRKKGASAKNSVKLTYHSPTAENKSSKSHFVSRENVLVYIVVELNLWLIFSVLGHSFESCCEYFRVHIFSVFLPFFGSSLDSSW